MDDRRAYIHEIFKIVGTDSILVMDSTGQLRRLYCPFWALVVIPVRQLQEGQRVLVEAVKMTLDLRDVFVIQGRAFYLFYFRIMVDDR